MINLLSRDFFAEKSYSFTALAFRSFSGLLMLPYGYGKVVNYDKYAADFFGDPIGIGDIPSLWLTIFAQTICPIALVLGFQTRIAAIILSFKDFVSKYSLVTIMKWLFTYSFICVLPFSANDLMATQWNNLTLETILGIIFIVIGATFFSYMLIVIGQKNLRPTVAGMYNYIQPLVACIVAICLGIESFNFMKIVAVLLVFMGVYLVTISKNRHDIEKNETNPYPKETQKI